eukprot:12403997-Karenia_brevis.AAC.1
MQKAAAYKARLELLKPVHYKVLPRHGFEASLEGVAQMSRMLISLGLLLERQSWSQSSEQGRLVLERGFEVAWLLGVGTFTHPPLPQGWEPKRQLIHDD